MLKPLHKEKPLLRWLLNEGLAEEAAIVGNRGP